MMANSIKILLPVFPSETTVCFSGFMCTSEQREIVIYITNYSTNPDYIRDNKFDKVHNIYGYSSDHRLDNEIIGENILVLNHLTQTLVDDLIINGKRVPFLDNCIIMLYDYERMKNSETMHSSCKYFSNLQGFLQNTNVDEIIEFTPLLKSTYWFISSSVLIQHVINYINLMNWLFSTIRKQRKVSYSERSMQPTGLFFSFHGSKPGKYVSGLYEKSIAKISMKPGNLMLAILTDIILGYFVLQLIAQDNKKLSSVLIGVLEKLVDSLYSLLKWLMGAPAGLKLNNAFNKMLGKYFSYHIQLWWLFLDVTGEKLDIILNIFHYLGNLGLTFQAAIISDMICVATFHSYCIYVYAARLFNIQVSGLIALLRFFVGRKYNPLRGRIDSCEYTNQELFVGTVAFTILLLLIPTTTMYYIVFTLFRLFSLGVQYILSKLIYWTQTIPLYVVALWIVRSPKVTGDILLEVVSNEEGKPLVLKVKLFNKSISELVNKLTPPVPAPKHFDWAQLLSNVFVGKFVK